MDLAILDQKNQQIALLAEKGNELLNRLKESQQEISKLTEERSTPEDDKYQQLMDQIEALRADNRQLKTENFGLRLSNEQKDEKILLLQDLVDKNSICTNTEIDNNELLATMSKLSFIALEMRKEMEETQSIIKRPFLHQNINVDSVDCDSNETTILQDSDTESIAQVQTELSLVFEEIKDLDPVKYKRQNRQIDQGFDIVEMTLHVNSRLEELKEQLVACETDPEMVRLVKCSLSQLIDAKQTLFLFNVSYYEKLSALSGCN